MWAASAAGLSVTEIDAIRPEEVPCVHRVIYDRQRREQSGWAILASIIANVHRDTSKRSRPYHPADFAPIFEADRAAAEAASLDPDRVWGAML